MLLFAHISAQVVFPPEPPIIASKPNRYSKESAMYMVTGQQVVALNYLFVNPCSIITQNERIKEKENWLPWTRFAKQSCENRAYRLFYSWKSIDDGLKANEKYIDPSLYYIPTESRFNSNRLPHKFRFKRDIWIIVGVVILATALISVVHNAITKAVDVLTWDEPSRPVSIAIETSKNEILSTLRSELWDLNKNITEDFQYYALYEEQPADFLTKPLSKGKFIICMTD